uniref:G_PROTEIN_RECEP_F2_4 domain-containing protein n=1 Tax=Panagrellus redivivus TaxID=6233 RepID=A0A7E4VYC4_PANRE
MSETCRLSGQFLPTALFRSIACAQCLLYIYFIVPPYTNQYKFNICPTGLLICNTTGNCNCQDNLNNTYNIPAYALNSTISQSIANIKIKPDLPPDFYYVTDQCCEAAALCCSEVLSKDSKQHHKKLKMMRSEKNALVSDAGGKSTQQPSNFGQKTCPATWDGWQCFERSSPGIITAACPRYIYGIQSHSNTLSTGQAKKQCKSDGTWYKFETKDMSEWTDYSGCEMAQPLKIRTYIGVIANLITVISIVPALIILSIHNSLNNQFVFRLHKNLLLSLLLVSLCYLFNYTFFINQSVGDEFMFANHVSCRLLFTLQLRYFRLVTFAWMLAEGVYLFRLLICTFGTESERLLPYSILCWGFPMIVTICYAILRQMFDNKKCWVEASKHSLIEWTLVVPCLLALFINIFLMGYIMFALYKKLRYNPQLEPVQYAKAAKAVTTLVPVFGIHLLLTAYVSETEIYAIFSRALDGIQGFLVALIVIYTNKQVIECSRKWLNQLMEQRKLRRQSEDNRLHFKRSIEHSFASLGDVGHRINNNTSETQKLKPLMSHDSEEHDESENPNVDSGAASSPPMVTSIEGVTTLMPQTRSVNFV